MGEDEGSLSEGHISGEYILIMIFVTVGTHEQPFDRLIKYIDRFAEGIDEEVIVQTGVSKYKPANCTWQSFYKQQEVYELIEAARIVITHGGPSSYIDVLQRGKIPIVVPRYHKYGEHFDDHQLSIGCEYKKLYNDIILIEDIELLGEAIMNYDFITSSIDNNYISHSPEFCKAFADIVDRLFP